MTLLTKVLGGCCACLFYFATLSLSAQEAVSDTITGKVHQIDKVTVTARKLPNKITSAVPIQTLSQQDISQLGIQNMADDPLAELSQCILDSSNGSIINVI